MKPKFPPKKNGKRGDSRGGDSGREALFLEKREQLIVAAVEVIREKRLALGLSKRRAALRAKISPSQWGQVERRVNGVSAEVVIRMGLAVGLRPSLMWRRAERRVWGGVLSEKSVK